MRPILPIVCLTAHALAAQLPMQAPSGQQPVSMAGGSRTSALRGTMGPGGAAGIGTSGTGLPGTGLPGTGLPGATGNGTPGSTQQQAQATAAGESSGVPFRAVVLEYDQQTSRDLFWACDTTGDDRLDLFEARGALAEIGDPTTTGWFRRLDADRDGYLEWPEFDRFYLHIIQAGNSLPLRLARAQPARPTGDAGKPQPELTPAERAIEMFDSNRDGGLDPLEAGKLIVAAQLPPMLAPMIMGLDGNRNGRLEAAEIGPALQQFHVNLFATKSNPAAIAITGIWAKIDSDGNNEIGALELAAALRRIDPALERWAEPLLQSADKDASKTLTANELGDKDPADTSTKPDPLPMAGDRGQR